MIYGITELVLNYNQMRSRGFFKESLTNLLENRKQIAILIGECSSSVSINISVPRGFFERSQDNIFGAE